MASYDFTRSFNGIWRWQVDEDVDSLEYKARGILTFTDTPQKAGGHSYIELPIAENSDGVAYANMAAEFSANRDITKDGKPRLSFEISHKDGRITRSEAVLDDDAKHIQGSSTVTNANKPGGSYSYTWTAERFVPGHS